MNIELDQEYKLNAPNCTGWYKVLHIYEDGTYKVQGAEAHPRFVLKQAFESPKIKPKHSKVHFAHTEIELFGILNGLECWSVNVTEFPSGEKRGRKAQNA